MHRSGHRPKPPRARETENKVHRQVAPSGEARSDSERAEREKALRALVENAKRALETPESERVAEQVQAFISAPPEMAALAIQEIGHQLQESSIPLLAGLLDAGRPDLELSAIDALGATKSDQAVPLLAAVIDGSKGSRSKGALKAARRSLFKLKSAGVHAELLPKPQEETVSPLVPADKLIKAYMSNHDGDGGQILLAAAEGPFGRLDAFTVITHEHRGIVHFDSFDTSRKKWQQHIDRLDQERGLTLVEIPLDYFRQKVRQAIETARGKGNPVPSGIARWSALIAEPKEPKESKEPQEPSSAEHPIYREISIVEIKWNPQLLEESTRLFHNEEMLGWLLNERDVASYVEELMAVRESRVTLPPWVEKEKMEAVIQRAMNQFFDAENRASYKRRLEDMAYLLLHTDRVVDAKRALAAAVAFSEQAGVPSEQHPFAAALLKHTTEFMAAEDRAARGESQRLITDLSDLRPFLSGELGTE